MTSVPVSAHPENALVCRQHKSLPLISQFNGFRSARHALRLCFIRVNIIAGRIRRCGRPLDERFRTGACIADIRHHLLQFRKRRCRRREGHVDNHLRAVVGLNSQCHRIRCQFIIQNMVLCRLCIYITRHLSQLQLQTIVLLRNREHNTVGRRILLPDRTVLRLNGELIHAVDRIAIAIRSHILRSDKSVHQILIDKAAEHHLLAFRLADLILLSAGEIHDRDTGCVSALIHIRPGDRLLAVGCRKATIRNNVSHNGVIPRRQADSVHRRSEEHIQIAIIRHIGQL